jgi:NADH:ubiquinone oxidoreductase subunit 3 (subunit A)
VEPFDQNIIIAPLLIVVADVLVYLLVSTWGKRSRGTGIKYQPFSGGEETTPARGLYRSELFVFAVLFLIVEAFALILASSFEATSNFYPLLFLAGGSGVVLIVTWWFMLVGGGEF